MFYKLVLRLLHHVLAIGVFLKQWLMYFPLFALAYQQKPVAGSLRSDARTLKKIPQHLGIVVLEHDINYNDIANLIVWSIALGISYISVYDFDGEFKRNSKVLKAEIDKSEESIKDTETSQYDINIYNGTTDLRLKKTYGCHDINQIHIQLLSVEDGRQDIVNITQDLCRQVMSQQCRIDDITTQNIEHLFLEIHKFPDPDLILKFGNTDSLLGFLPWQTRLTEILSIPTHRGYLYKSFISQMSVFGKAQQRFGK